MKQRQQQNENIDPKKLFDPIMAGEEEIKFTDDAERDLEAITPMHEAYSFWIKDGQTENQFDEETGISVIDFINLVFGTSGIFDIRDNPDINPLAQLSVLGKGMMDAVVRNIAFGAFGEGISRFLPGFAGEMGKTAGSFLWAMAMATIAQSFVLYYVLPSLPFIYFIFAVSGWVKSIFEAIVAMPLWAFAHITRMDGEGLPGPAATNGYALLLEIFIRPILILIGLVASISIFSALVMVLNDIWDLVMSNVAGFDMQTELDSDPNTENVIEFMRGPIDQFFMTALYVIVVYMIGLGSFKMIDAIPQQILRWAGITVSTFQESAGDPAGQAIQQTYRGTLLVSGQVRGGALAALMD